MKQTVKTKVCGYYSKCNQLTIVIIIDKVIKDLSHHNQSIKYKKKDLWFYFISHTWVIQLWMNLYDTNLLFKINNGT